MNKTLLTITAFMALGAMNSQAQQLKFFEEQEIVKMSIDGKILVSADTEGGLVVFNTDDDTYTIFEADESTYDPYYSVGFGNIISNNGTMVGNYSDSKPAYCNGENWTVLPMAEGDDAAGHMSSADGITPDGKRICGGMARASFSVDAEDIMMVPVIWEMGEDGQYGMYKVLPHPALDFSGRVPQYITARGISDDGKTIIGQIVDYSGAYPLPIVYREDANGDWSYEVIGTDLVYDSSISFPEWPAVEPKAPNASEYMTEEEMAAYNAAYAEYEALVDAYFSGEIDEYPTQPKYADFISDPTAYNADYEKYQEEQNAYNEACDAFYEVFYDYEKIYGTSYNFNSILLSRDGKYAASMYMGENLESEDFDGWGMPMFYKLVRFDLQAEGNPYEISEDKNAIPTDFLNDGTVVYASPADDYARCTYLMPQGSTSSISLVDYMQNNCPAAAEMLAEQLTFTKAAYDEDWNVVPGETVVSTGTTVATGDGKIFAGWMYNMFVDDPSWEFKSYWLNTNSTDAIQAVAAEPAHITSVMVTDLSGKVIYRGTDTVAARKAMNFGVNMLTTTLSDGTTKTVKVSRN